MPVVRYAPCLSKGCAESKLLERPGMALQRPLQQLRVLRQLFQDRPLAVTHVFRACVLCLRRSHLRIVLTVCFTVLQFIATVFSLACPLSSLYFLRFILLSWNSLTKWLFPIFHSCLVLSFKHWGAHKD